MTMGMMGTFIVHPRDPSFRRADRDFVFVMSAYDIEAGSYIPKVAEMTDFNMWTWNSRVFRGSILWSWAGAKRSGFAWAISP